MAEPVPRVTLVRGPVTIAPDKMWTDAAATWPVYVDPRETQVPAEGEEGYKLASDFGVYEVRGPLQQLHLCCARCDQSVLCLAPGTGEPYRVMVADMLANILGHLRRSHPDVVES
jgi:hypothetical protein